MTALETDRLSLRRLTPDDAPFILELLNDPGWLRFIGDRGVRTVEDARAYVSSGPVAMYERVGFGLYATERKEDAVPMGICGLIKREGLDDIDIGFAFLPRFCANGYAEEAAYAVMAYGKRNLGLTRIVGITSPDNVRSIRLLKKLGMAFERMVQLPTGPAETMLFAWDA
jgi:RimJ/RimL family protein N-acetyltransferase